MIWRQRMIGYLYNNVRLPMFNIPQINHTVLLTVWYKGMLHSLTQGIPTENWQRFLHFIFGINFARKCEDEGDISHGCQRNGGAGFHMLQGVESNSWQRFSDVKGLGELRTTCQTNLSRRKRIVCYKDFNRIN